MLRRRALPAEREETGVIAIIVAISLSTFLLGFAALAVDMGSAYARQADIQATAEQLAVAGAAGLPDISDALDKMEEARDRLCVDNDLPGVCGAAPVTSWAQDGNLANGEVRFYDDRGQSGMFAQLAAPAGLDAGDFLAYSATTASGLRVLLPPSRVEFGLASAIGFEGVNVTRAATARIGTPLGLGVLPFALTQKDLDAGQFCVKDPKVTGETPPPPPSGDRLVSVSQGFPPRTTVTVRDTGEQTLDVNLVAPTVIIDSSVEWHASNSTDRDKVIEAERVPRTLNTWRVHVPAAAAGTTVYVWATGNYVWLPPTFSSQAFSVIFDDATPDDGLCSESAAYRGFVDLARNDGGDALTRNVRQGPQTKLYDTTTRLGENLIDSTLDCVANVFASSTACLSQQITPPSPFMNLVRAGMLTPSGGKPGRLQGDCGMGTLSARPGVDGSHLIDGSNDYLLNKNTPSQLRTRILTRGDDAAADGWAGAISSRALRCPRLAVMPVVEPLSIAGIAGGQKIVKFAYVWIDEAGSASSARGLNFVSGGRLSSFRGYVIEPGLLPAQVAGSPLVGPYMGTDMPKQVVLVHDLGADRT